MKRKPETADLLDILSSRHLAAWRSSFACSGCGNSQHHRLRADHREGKDSRGDAAFWNDDRRLARLGRMAPAERNPTRGDGIDGSVLETGVEYFGAGRARVAVGERARSQSGAGTKD